MLPELRLRRDSCASSVRDQQYIAKFGVYVAPRGRGSKYPMFEVLDFWFQRRVEQRVVASPQPLGRASAKASADQVCKEAQIRQYPEAKRSNNKLQMDDF